MARPTGGRCQILWRTHVWKDGAWKVWSGDSGDVRLNGPDRDRDAEGKQRREAVRLACRGRVVKLTRLGATIEFYNLGLVPDDKRREAMA